MVSGYRFLSYFRRGYRLNPYGDSEEQGYLEIWIIYRVRFPAPELINNLFLKINP